MIEQLLGISSSGGNDNGYPNDRYLGEVSAADFITNAALTSLVGLTVGGQINTDIGWLRFRIEGKFIWVAKRPFRYQISWNSLDTLGIIHGTKTVTIGGQQYAVRVLRGAEADPSAWTTDMGQSNPPILGPSEWNRLIMRVSVNNPGPASNWALFTNVELGVGEGAGARTLCKETVANPNTYCVGRGFPELKWFNYQFKDSGFASQFDSHGWRPVLELIP